MHSRPEFACGVQLSTPGTFLWQTERVVFVGHPCAESPLRLQDGRQAARCIARFQDIMRTLLADVKVCRPL